jgi:predicted DCC family thiol-disulfide oxidoreductase YuxK
MPNTLDASSDTPGFAKRESAITKITLLYDPECPLCLRCRHWMAAQESLVELELLPTTSEEAKLRYGEVPWLGEEVVVVANTGDVWAGSAAFVVALWALRDWRLWSYRLSGSMLSPLAERFFLQVSKNRHWLGSLLSHEDCPDGHCQLPPKTPPYR